MILVSHREVRLFGDCEFRVCHVVQSEKLVFQVKELVISLVYFPLLTPERDLQGVEGDISNLLDRRYLNGEENFVLIEFDRFNKQRRRRLHYIKILLIK